MTKKGMIKWSNFYIFVGSFIVIFLHQKKLINIFNVRTMLQLVPIVIFVDILHNLLYFFDGEHSVFIAFKSNCSWRLFVVDDDRSHYDFLNVWRIFLFLFQDQLQKITVKYRHKAFCHQIIVIVFPVHACESVFMNNNGIWCSFFVRIKYRISSFETFSGILIHR